MIPFISRTVAWSLVAATGFTLALGIATASHEPTPTAVVASRHIVVPDTLGEGRFSEADRAALRRQATAALDALVSRGAAPARAAAKGDRLVPKGAGCADAAWPHIPADCLTAADGRARQNVRYVTVERRVGPDRSELVRTPATRLAVW